jgi:hypothetical protein
MIRYNSNSDQQHIWNSLSVRRHDPTHVPAVTSERQSVTPLPIRGTPRHSTPPDQVHDATPYVLTSTRAPYGYTLPLNRALEPQSAAFARSQQGGVSTAAHSRGIDFDDDDYAMESRRSHGQPPTERRAGITPGRTQNRRLDRDGYPNRYQINDGLDYGAGSIFSRDDHAHHDGLDYTVPRHGQLYHAVGQEHTSVHNRDRGSANPLSTSRQEPPFPYRRDSRSRSPAKILRSPAERKHSSVRGQGDFSHEHYVTSGTAEDVEEVDHGEIPGATGNLAPEHPLRGSGFAARFRTDLQLPEIQRQKNLHSICICCWEKDLDCDHESPCRECRKRGKTCAYAVCPIPVCHLHVKCPAVHILPGLPLDDRKMGTSMHLIALLGLKRSVIRSYDIDEIQAMHDNKSSAQFVYVKMQEEIKAATQRGEEFDKHVARQLLKNSDKAPKMSGRRLDTTASMIVKLVE